MSSKSREYRLSAPIMGALNLTFLIANNWKFSQDLQ